MESVDSEKLEKSIIYLQRIADGKNPVTNMPAPEDSVLNNPNVIRCMYFVKEILEEVKRNGGCIGKKKKNSDVPDFPLSVLNGFVYQEDKSITKVVGQINELIDSDLYVPLTYSPVVKWLKQNGYLTEDMNQELGKKVTMATEKGTEIGIYSEKRESMYGKIYMATLYGKQAQEFIISNMKEILNGNTV